MKNRIKNPKWELALNLLLIPIPIAVFIKDGFETKNMGPGGPFLYFAYLTHVKDMAVMLGIAIPDAIGATKLIKQITKSSIQDYIGKGSRHTYASLKSIPSDTEAAFKKSFKKSLMVEEDEEDEEDDDGDPNSGLPKKIFVQPLDEDQEDDEKDFYNSGPDEPEFTLESLENNDESKANGNLRTFVRYQAMSLLVTADLLFWVLVFLL